MEHIKQTLGKITQNRLTRVTELPSISEEPKQDERFELWNRLNVSSLEHTFDNYKVLRGNRNAYDTMVKLAKGDIKKKFIFLYGVVGCGKTHLIEALLIEWAKQEIVGRYETMSQIMRRLKSSMRMSPMPMYDVYFKQYCEARILVIDDYGAGVQETAYEIADIEDIINERYQRRYRDDGKITIMATNKDIKEIPNRVLDRFYESEFGIVVFNEASSYRRKKI